MADKKQRVILEHGFGPFFLPDSRMLILGSFPSVKSRETQFFYGHPQNRFWALLACLCSEDIPGTLEEKKAFLARNRIALYDVIERCSIVGSSDSSIRDVEPADLRPILNSSKVGNRIFVNGAKAHTLYQRYIQPVLGIQAEKLPSTSPANAACSLDALIAAWGEKLDPILKENHMNVFICYDRCSTCKKAELWLQEHGIAYVKRPIKEENPSAEELRTWIDRSEKPIRSFFNTSGMLYKQMELKDKLPNMRDEDMLSLLATDGMLVKRPLLVSDQGVLVGFRPEEWAKRLLK